MSYQRRAWAIAACLLISTATLAQVDSARLEHAADEPENWLTYSGTYRGQRHTSLRQVRRNNVADLELAWVFQSRSLESLETTPLVVDGIMYLTEPPSTVTAVAR